MRLFQKEVDNDDVLCRDCIFHGKGDYSIGINPGCQHPILYDEKDDIIDEVNDLILDCVNNPKHCILFMDRKAINRSDSIQPDMDIGDKVKLLNGDGIFEVNAMRAFNMDDYYTVVAHNKEEAIAYHEEINCEEVDEKSIKEIDPQRSTMFFAISDIPAERVKELILRGEKIKKFNDDLCFNITKSEVMVYRNATEPYTLSISADLL